MYNNARAIASGKVDLEVSWGTVGGILLLGFLYMVTASVGINIFSKCEAMKGKPIQENLNKYLVATLTIGLTIPFTLLITKLAKNEAGVFMIIYSIMGLIGSAVALNWTLKCEKSKESERNYSAISLAVFATVLLGSAYVLRPKVMRMSRGLVSRTANKVV
jgi:heme/copper-type cytochrome/quinol oxidase subunit 4